jgi:hypothetical protein
MQNRTFFPFGCPANSLGIEIHLRKAFKQAIPALVALTFFCFAPALAYGQFSISKTADMLLDSNALLMPSTGDFSRVINGGAHQSEALITHNGYQFATWYQNGSGGNQHIMLARRNLNGNTWESYDTGYDMQNGDEGSWDSHNVIAMGISGDGRIHLAYDHHADNLRYLTTRGVNKATGTWDQNLFVPGGERSKFNAQDSGTVSGITYPRFASSPNGDLAAVYRTGGSGSGDTYFLSYNSGSTANEDGVLQQRWSDSHKVIDGRSRDASSYTDGYNNSSSDTRNAYLNGIDAGADGRLHMTWTWRETPSDPNHGIMYAYSDDGGSVWRNNNGTVVANKATGQTINLDSQGIEVVGLDRTQSVMNQQGQTVDQFGGVHALMWHRRDDGVNGEFDWVEGERFNGRKSAYYHHFRDPLTGEWTQSQLPTSERVGTRPKIGHDANGDLYAVYTSLGRLVIAGATRANNYDDWSILWNREDDNQQWASSALLDQDRLLNDGVLSVFLQEGGPDSSGPTGTNLRVLEFSVVAVPEPSGGLAIAIASLVILGRRKRR